jgi:hypothetical protein
MTKTDKTDEQKLKKTILGILSVDLKQNRRARILAGKLGNIDDHKKHGAIEGYIEELIQRTKTIK